MTTDIEIEKEEYYGASQWHLVWCRFKKHKIAMISVMIVLFLYIIALCTEFFATGDPDHTHVKHAYLPPQTIHWFDEGSFNPHVYGIKSHRDMETFQLVFKLDPNQKIAIRFFAKGFEYKWLGFIPSSRHLFSIETNNKRKHIYLLGTDQLGRDLWSRLIYGTRVSMSIGLIGVTISLLLGVSLGGISGYFAGWVDMVIQRVIEFIRSIPTIPLWMGLAAALPKTWSNLQNYFAITIIVSLIGWTELARVVRGKFLSLREDDFVLAARLIGCSESRIIFRHMVPSFLSHIIAATTLAIPAMIISETTLSFLGLGLRSPTISWGVLLQKAQNIQAIALYPWLLLPAIAVMVTVLAFNFMGDGLRDAADPYAS